MAVLASAETTATYVSGTVAILAIAATLAATWLTLRQQARLARQTLDQQARLAQEERLWTHRAETYIRFLEHQREDPAFERILPADLAARIIAFGSEEVNNALGVVRAAAKVSPDAFEVAFDGIAAQIRVELQDRQDEQRLHLVTRHGN